MTEAFNVNVSSQGSEKGEMKVLVCASEFYPYNPMGGIGMCVYQVVKYLKRWEIKYDICSPYGPEIKIPLDFIKKNYGVLSLLRYWHQVYKHFEDYTSNYDVVWLHQPFMLAKCPFENCLVTMHTSIFDYNKIVQKSNYPTRLKIYYSLREKIEKRCIQAINHYASYFSVVSPHIESALEELGVSHTKILYIPNGVDIDKFKPNPHKGRLRDFYNIPRNDIVFTYVGRITWPKRPFTLIRFFSKISQRLKNVSLIIAGDGDLLNDTKQLAFKLGLKKILFLGYVSNERLPSVYACSDVYLMTSIYEGGAPPITVLEAMSSGLPPIVSDIPSLRHIVKESNVGLVIDFNNMEEGVKKTLQFIKEDLWEHSRRARRFIEDNHNWEIIAGRYMQLFNKIASI